MQMVSMGTDKAIQKMCRTDYQKHQLSPYYLQQLAWLQSIKLTQEDLPADEFWFGHGDLYAGKSGKVI